KGIFRHFQIRMDFQFVKLTAKEPLPHFDDSSEICTSASPDHYDLENWLRVMPLSKFDFSGFLLLEADDITVTQSVATLNEAVLNQEEITSGEFLEVVEDSVKSLLGIFEVKVGLASLQQVKGKLVFSPNRLASSYILKMLCEEGGEVPYQGVLNFL